MGSGRHSWIHGACCLLQAVGRDAGRHYYFARSSFRSGSGLVILGGEGVSGEGWRGGHVSVRGMTEFSVT